ncbi:hypothetical protein A9P82_02470 [Arachidicoccus ginsenosidimutans]|uniref:RNA polymerase sigma factor n=1 Tax=Arachidicoccus sp. BS20 TaxID=1850526 RepID=UPI0007F14B4E|nr:sigma-70 family RNA polymerase sigma factor [Arachidicoccus sp. BS20]ANI88266.1 hypothetical protein A9P82_02470 [Arachidicoccus sp. BS20]
MSERIYQSDEILFQLIKNDDKVAFTEIYNRFWDKLCVVACNKLKDCFIAEDIVQELFIEIWNRRHTIVINKTVNSFLAAALKYKIIKARVRIKDALDKKVQITSDNSSIDDFTAHEMITFSELQFKLEKLVKKLPEKCRLIYKMYKEEDYSSKDISEMLNLSQRTVESHLYRAVKTLKEQLLNAIESYLEPLHNILSRYFFSNKNILP